MAYTIHCIVFLSLTRADKQVHIWNITAGVKFSVDDGKFGAKRYRQLSWENATAEIFRSLNHDKMNAHEKRLWKITVIQKMEEKKTFPCFNGKIYKTYIFVQFLWWEMLSHTAKRGVYVCFVIFHTLVGFFLCEFIDKFPSGVCGVITACAYVVNAPIIWFTWIYG